MNRPNGVTTEFVLDENTTYTRILGEIRSDGGERLYAYGPEGFTAQQTIGGGIEYPLQVYLTCVQVLQTRSDAPAQKQAAEILQTAHTTLMEQAGGISDLALRHSFLQNVAANREIQRAWAALPKSESADV